MRPKISLIIPVYNAEDTLQRALDSVPIRNDIQIIIVDDGSTDRSWEIALDWWRDHAVDGNGSTTHRWENNKGVASALNLGFELARGEYIVWLSSDDWFKEDFTHIWPYLDGENDLVFFDLEVNDGSIWRVTPESKKLYVGGVKFIRREFMGDNRIPTLKWHEDVPFANKLYSMNPKEVFTGIVLKHYDFPRVGSLTWQATHKEQK